MRPAYVAVVLAALALAVAAWFGPPTAFAHARLVSSNPPAGARLDTPPAEVVLGFSEPVSVQLSSIKLYDRAHREIPADVPRTGEGTGSVTIRAAVRDRLAPGYYLVEWRAVSAVDGHLTVGLFAFRVLGPGEGAASTTPAGTEGQQDEAIPPDVSGVPLEGRGENPDPLRLLVRTVMLAGAAFLLGSAVFSLSVVEPTAQEDRAAAALMPVVVRRFGYTGTVAACLLILALVFDLVGEVASVGGGGYGAVPESGWLARELLTATRYGLGWSLKILAAIGLLAIAVYLWKRRKGPVLKLGPTPWDLMTASGSLLLLGEAITSHAAAAESGHAGGHVLGLPLPVVSDWLHLVVASVWAGGLAYMALVLFPVLRRAAPSPEERRRLLARAVPRFSRLAVFSVLVLAVTGTYNLLIHSTNLTSIAGSAYGWVLAAKIALFVALVAIGAVNLLRLSPRLQGTTRMLAGLVPTAGARRQLRSLPAPGPPNPGAGAGVEQNVQAGEPGSEAVRAVNRLSRNVMVEVGLVMVVLGLAAMLTLLPPPGGAGTTYAGGGRGGAQGAASTPTPGAGPTPTGTLLPAPAWAGTVTATAESSYGGYRLLLNARHSPEGDQLTLDIGRVSGGAPALTDVSKVRFRITPQQVVDTVSTSYLALEQGGSGEGADRRVWALAGPLLPVEGEYLITTVAERTSAPDLKAQYLLTLTADRLEARAIPVTEVRLATSPAPPVTGVVTLTVSLVDASGRPATAGSGPANGETAVFVRLSHPATGQTGPDQAMQPVPGQDGSYRLPVRLDSIGSWLLVFTIKRNSLPAISTDASIEVQKQK